MKTLTFSETKDQAEPSSFPRDDSCLRASPSSDYDPTLTAPPSPVEITTSSQAPPTSAFEQQQIPLILELCLPFYDLQDLKTLRQVCRREAPVCENLEYGWQLLWENLYQYAIPNRKCSRVLKQWIQARLAAVAEGSGGFSIAGRSRSAGATRSFYSSSSSSPTGKSTSDASRPAGEGASFSLDETARTFSTHLPLDFPSQETNCNTNTSTTMGNYDKQQQFQVYENAVRLVHWIVKRVKQEEIEQLLGGQFLTSALYLLHEARHECDMECKNVWVWKMARFVMLVWHDSALCIAWPPRGPLACHAKAQFLMRTTQHIGTKKLVMLGCAVQRTYCSRTCITSFQTQTYLQPICEKQRQEEKMKKAPANVIAPKLWRRRSPSTMNSNLCMICDDHFTSGTMVDAATTSPTNDDLQALEVVQPVQVEQISRELRRDHDDADFHDFAPDTRSRSLEIPASLSPNYSEVDAGNATSCTTASSRGLQKILSDDHEVRLDLLLLLALLATKELNNQKHVTQLQNNVNSQLHEELRLIANEEFSCECEIPIAEHPNSNCAVSMTIYQQRVKKELAKFTNNDENLLNLLPSRNLINLALAGEGSPATEAAEPPDEERSKTEVATDNALAHLLRSAAKANHVEVGRLLLDCFSFSSSNTSAKSRRIQSDDEKTDLSTSEMEQNNNVTQHHTESNKTLDKMLGKDANSRDLVVEVGHTQLSAFPLLIAAKEGNCGFCRMLLHFRADVNQKDQNGRTALMMAICYKRKNVVEMFLRDSSRSVDHQLVPEASRAAGGRLRENSLQTQVDEENLRLQQSLQLNAGAQRSGAPGLSKFQVEQLKGPSHFDARLHFPAIDEAREKLKEKSNENH
ncbi:unnamed protein product [Amoebophrya sp. A120]|nr:unnamed protein product [Amoebophrya sp. A120]|eukprot:GSA120T00020492001.1